MLAVDLNECSTSRRFESRKLDVESVPSAAHMAIATVDLKPLPGCSGLRGIKKGLELDLRPVPEWYRPASSEVPGRPASMVLNLTGRQCAQ